MYRPNQTSKEPKKRYEILNVEKLWAYSAGCQYLCLLSMNVSQNKTFAWTYVHITFLRIDLNCHTVHGNKP